MKLCIVVAVVFLQAVVLASADESPATAPSTSCSCSSAANKKVCYKLSELKATCPPCPPACPGFNNCPCTYDGTVIQPKQLNYNNRPPYCPGCIQCRILVKCDITQPCTASHIQGLINM